MIQEIQPLSPQLVMMVPAKKQSMETTSNHELFV